MGQLSSSHGHIFEEISTRAHLTFIRLARVSVWWYCSDKNGSFGTLFAGRSRSWYNAAEWFHATQWKMLCIVTQCPQLLPCGCEVPSRTKCFMCWGLGPQLVDLFTESRKRLWRLSLSQWVSSLMDSKFVGIIGRWWAFSWRNLGRARSRWGCLWDSYLVLGFSLAPSASWMVTR